LKVVSNSSILIALSRIEQLDLLSQRFEEGIVKNEIVVIELTFTPEEITVPSINNGGNPAIAWEATGSASGKCSASFNQREKWMFVNYTSDKACDGRIFFTTTRSVPDGTYEGIVKICADGTNYCNTKSFVVKVKRRVGRSEAETHHSGAGLQPAPQHFPFSKKINTKDNHGLNKIYYWIRLGWHNFPL